jgi:hypothetical protein
VQTARATASRVNWFIFLAYRVGVINKGVRDLTRIRLSNQAPFLPCALIIEEILDDQLTTVTGFPEESEKFRTLDEISIC